MRYIIAILILFFSCQQKSTSLSESQEPVQTFRNAATSAFYDLRIYQIMVESFVDGDNSVNYNVGWGPSQHKGDLRGIIQSLPYIKELGMNAIWLTPIFDSNGSDKLDATGYFAYNYFKIDPKFGSFEDAKELVDTAHELGLYVFFDGVFGHHKDGHIPASPSGHYVNGNNPNKYPESLQFYLEFANYWIDALEIDGWRLDQAYQVPIEYWRKIRSAVETKCTQRKQAGYKWGTLGYMVAEVWDTDAARIQNAVYGPNSNPALYSAFDFPLRYALVRTLAGDENKYSHPKAWQLNEGFKTRKQYSSHTLPNLMISNHDFVRFGDLIERAGLAGPYDHSYWRRHKMAFSFLAAHSGPITIYYGDEIGDELPEFSNKVLTDCWKKDLCDDHVGRTNAKIDGVNYSLNENQRDLKNYVTLLMKLRDKYPALAQGQREHLISNDQLYLDLKIHPEQKILYALNISSTEQTVFIDKNQLDSELLKDLISAEEIEWHDDLSPQGLTIFSSENQYFKLSIPAQSARFFVLK